MFIYVYKTGSDVVVSYRVKPNSLLSTVKKQFCNSVGIYKESAKMMCEGEELDERKTIEQNGLDDEDYVHIHPVGNEFEYWAAA